MSSRNKIIGLIVALVLIAGGLHAQTPQPTTRNNGVVTAVDYNLMVRNGFKIPVFIDTTHALTMMGIDSIGYIFKEYGSSKIWVRDSNLVAGAHIWTQVGTGGGSVSAANPTAAIGGTVVNGTASTFMRSDAAPPLAANGVANASLAQMPTHTVKGNGTSGTANASDLTGVQVTALLAVVTTGAQGVAPASGGGTTNFLRADGTWAAPPGGGGSPANPTAVIGASPVNGTASTFLRSDGAPKLDTFFAETKADAQNKIDSFAQTDIRTASNDRAISASDSTMYPDLSGNINFRGLRVHSSSGTVTVTETASTLHTIDIDLSASAGSAPPFPDNAALAKNNADPTRLAVLDVSQVPTGTTVRDSLPSVSTGIPGTNVANTYQFPQNFLFGFSFGGTASGSIYASPTDMLYGIPTTKAYFWKINSAQVMKLSTTGQLILGSGSGYTPSGGTPTLLFGLDASGNSWPISLGSGFSYTAQTLNYTAPASFARQSITSGTSATGTSTTNTLRVLFNFTTTVSAYSFTMPPAPADGQIVEFAGNGTLSYPSYEITTLTIVPNSGQSLSYTIPLTTFQAGEFSRWEYFSSTSTWQREL